MALFWLSDEAWSAIEPHLGVPGTREFRGHNTYPRSSGDTILILKAHPTRTSTAVPAATSRSSPIANNSASANT